MATKSPAWKAEPFLHRLVNCVRMLNIHGMLTDAERRKVLNRIRKQFSRRMPA